MEFFRSRKLYFGPTVWGILILTGTYVWPHIFTAQALAIFYWILGTVILINLTRIISRNTEEQSKANQALEEQKRYLENLIEGAPEGIVWEDANQRIKYVNQKFVELFGYGRKEVIGKNVDQLLTDEDTFQEARNITEAVISGATRQFDGFRKRKDGSLIHVSIVGAPVAGKHGELEVFGLYRDTTIEWQREQRLIESEASLRNISEQLSDANNFKELLLDIITHDLRNPAGVITGTLELLKEQQVESDLLELIKNSADNLNDVIENASTLSKLSIGEEIELEPLDLVPILEDVARTFNSQLKMADMHLELELPESLQVRSNSIIGEVVSNYLSNGIKYASEGKRLILRAVQEPEKGPRIELEDFGATIPEDKRQAIFNRRIQLLEGPRRGSGLGLAIVKRIAAANSAQVGVLPKSTGGNIFYFDFRDSSPSESNPF